MRKLTALIGLISILIAPLAACADPVPTSSLGYGSVAFPDYSICPITGTTAVVCNRPGGTRATHLLAVFNNSISAQTATVTCYDNATAASGSVAASIASLGPTQIIVWPLPGRSLTNGLTCISTAAPNGTGIEVYAF